MKYATFLIALCAVFCRGNAVCSRGFTSTAETPDDCTTVSGHPNDTEQISCFVYEDEIPFQLENPQENTRTCYRTCHDIAAGICNASLVANIHNKAITIDTIYYPNSTGTLQTIFSPNYNKNKDYRKSTICRYDVTCSEGQILSYMFIDHGLENRTNSCVISNKCVDYVELMFPNSTDEVKTCGYEAQLDTLFADGRSAIYVEFYANRHEEDEGFSMSVWCSDPGVEPAKRKRQAPADEERECVQVSSTERPTVDSSQQLLEALSSSRYAQEDLRNLERCRLFIVNELETLYYRSRKLVIRTRRHCEEDVFEKSVGRKITILYVSNRFNRSNIFQDSARTLFQGYAELYVCGEHAYLLQLGVNPLFRPTREEEDLIAQLQRAITKYVECREFFDVYDELDAEEEGVEYKSSICANNFRRECHLDDLARQYRNACNPFLRSSACSYLTLILKEVCTTQ